MIPMLLEPAMVRQKPEFLFSFLRWQCTAILILMDCIFDPALGLSGRKSGLQRHSATH